MAYLTTSTTPSFLAPLRHMIDGIAAGVTRRRQYRQTLNELQSLSNRELADLGLHRSQLHQIALEAAQG